MPTSQIEGRLRETRPYLGRLARSCPANARRLAPAEAVRIGDTLRDLGRIAAQIQFRGDLRPDPAPGADDPHRFYTLAWTVEARLAILPDEESFFELARRAYAPWLPRSRRPGSRA